MKHVSVRKESGQLTILDYLKEIEAKPSASSKLMPGQVVFLVEKANISRHEVYGIFEVYGEEKVILISREGSDKPFSSVSVDEIDDTLFESEQAAKDQVLKTLEECDCILASDMKVLGFKAFTAISEDGALLTAFYAQLANGYIYIKDYYSVGHLVKTSLEDAERLLMKGIESYDLIYTPSNKIPKLKNMYRTDPSCTFEWEYAEKCCC